MAHPPVNPVPAPSLPGGGGGGSLSAAVRPALLENLTTQTHLLSSLFTLLSSPNPSGPGSPSAHTVQGLYSALVRSTEQLQGALDETYAHQASYTRLMRLSSEVRGLEGEVRARLRSLEGGIGELEGFVKEGKKVREGMDKSENDPISSSTLLAAAQNLAAHSSAPVSELLAPEVKKQYMPWPTEQAMRRGLLFMMGGSMSGIGDTGKIGDETTSADKMDIDPAPQQQQQYQPVREEETRRYDPNAVFQLELNSDSDSDS